MKDILKYFDTNAWTPVGSFHILPSVELQFEWFKGHHPNHFLTLNFKWLWLEAYISYKTTIY